jgi:hypothetical protein
VAQSVGLEFKQQYSKKKEKRENEYRIFKPIEIPIRTGLS